MDKWVSIGDLMYHLVKEKIYSILKPIKMSIFRKSYLIAAIKVSINIIHIN